MKNCGLCQWHHKRMWKSGRHPIYWSYCEHPTKVVPGSREQTFGKLSDGEKIGEHDITPEWCPLVPGNF